jgi:hypothetical protein
MNTPRLRLLVPLSFLFICFLSVAIAGGPGQLPREVTVIDAAGDWEVNGDLPKQALLISLQGLSNRNAPNIYLLYNADYVHTEVRPALEFYKKRHGMKTVTAETVEDAVAKYRDFVKGYVVWDPGVLTSLLLSYTVAGLEDALVITDAYIPLMEKLGIKPVIDFRGKFKGKSDLEIYQWAYNQYWGRCSRDYLVYLGEFCTGLKGGPGKRPAVADFAIVKRAFCTDLSAMPADTGENRLANQIMSEMHPYAYVYGWHSYCKDKEEEHITMLSRHSLIMAEGLAELPNMSFHGQVPVSPDFKFKQKGSFNPNPAIKDKVYLTLIQSDGMGIGAWSRPGRGEIPYGWEANEEWFETAPALLQFYYETATPNDHFIGSLSGPGYFYPKAYPPSTLPGALRREDTLMRKMDLHVHGIMDFSEGDHAVGNADLTRQVVDAYYQNMTSADGFLNGYGPANTYDCRNGKALISYNYYVDLKKSVDEVAEDLRELARINPKRPYFLPVHVREDNDVERMKKIIDRLGGQFEVVPPREFMIMAGKKPTMTQRFLDGRPDFSGRWKLVPSQSHNVFPTSFQLEIDHRGDVFTITTTALEGRYTHHRKLTTTKSLRIGGPSVSSQEEMTRRLGYLAGWSDSIASSAAWKADGRTLMVETQLNLATSQGHFPAVSTSEYFLSEDGMTLTVTERRSTRTLAEPAVVCAYRRVLERVDGN